MQASRSRRPLWCTMIEQIFFKPSAQSGDSNPAPSIGLPTIWVSSSLKPFSPRRTTPDILPGVADCSHWI